jgi:DNA polymerase-3 subunit alpha
MGMAMWNTYDNRLKYELGVIEQMGFANYFVLTDNVIREARKQGILVNARGSANGSLVLYALGITNVDPIEWDVPFDRFLHPSRKKPPDIDFDIDRDRRPEFIEIIEQQAGSATPIGTYGRLTDSEDRGAIFIKYVSYRKRIGKPVDIEQLRELEDIAPDDMPVLRRLASMSVLTGGGTHAAGYLLDHHTQPMKDYIPLMRVGGINGNVVTQYEDQDCEEFGYVKMDALGLAALTTCANVLTQIGKDPVKGLSWIKPNDKEACKILRSGRTGTGIFQFEGYSTAKGARDMGVRSTKDAILALALFRPASQDSGATDEYLYYRKTKGAEPKYIHDVFRTVTKETYGVFVLQDQVIELLRRIGMSYEDLNDMLSAVKMSNHNVRVAQQIFDRIQPNFDRLCRDQGMDSKTAKKAWKKVMGFSDYGFNKAHATSYGLMAYRMAWLKAYHEKEFMAALLATWAGKPKEKMYLQEARHLGLRIGRADVNASKANWSLDKTGLLRRGLLSVPGLGEKSSQEIVAHQPYDTVDDIIERCNGTNGYVTGGKSWKKDGTLNGVLGTLKEAGALKSIMIGDE